MEENYAFDLDAGDFLTNRNVTIRSMNYNSSLIKENKEKMYSKIFYVFSLIFAILIAIFAGDLNWVLVLLFGNLSLIPLIWFAKRFYKKRRVLAKHRIKIIRRLNEFGIPLKE